MIVARIMGGLGNQMFQYAFGLYLAERHGAELLLDCSSYSTDPLRAFMLDRWNVAAAQADDGARQCFPRRLGGLGWRALWRGKRPLKHVRERPFGFDASYLDVRDGAYLDGYWQSERFFPLLKQRLRKVFWPAGKVTAETAALGRQMERTPAVALHVRRTDYLKLTYATACSLDYYRRSVDELLEHHEGVHLFVFSDDIGWCRRHVKFRAPVSYVSHTDAATAHEDIWLMSRCRHHVIANSTFSWWGAWLAEDESGATFAPHPWFADPTMDSSSILPPAWRQVSHSALPMAA